MPQAPVPQESRVGARHETAPARDLAARARDQAADARDRAMVQRDADDERRAAQHRTLAAEQRTLAAQDRLAAAEDRAQAAGERRRAHADREALAHELAIAETDDLTGVRARAAGLADLDRELDRCRRGTGVLALAYVDVVGLKAVNDAEGHAAGDELLKRVAATIGAHMRSYDLTIRMGGDEFVCAMSNTTSPAARRRFGAITAELAAAPAPAAIATGFAQLATGETASELIRRADGELIANRNGNGRNRRQPSAGRAGELI